MLLGLIVLGVIVVGGAWVWATSPSEIAAIEPPDPASLDSQMIEDGEFLALVGDCSACHSTPNGERYAGGLPLPTPFGTIYSTNITPDRETGIGSWSQEAFSRAMRDGLDRNGNHLYPAFPYDHFAKTTDADLEALYAYFMAQPAVSSAPPPNELDFPFSYRPLLAGWKLLFHDPAPFEPDPALDDEQNRGKYLVEGLGHCGACHSPRNAFGAVDTANAFAGGEAEGWSVPAIAERSTSPVAWSMDDYVDYLFDGWDEEHGIAAGPMTSVADHLYDADEDDVFAMAAYLASRTGEPDDAAREAAIDAAAAMDWGEEERPGGANAPTDALALDGEQVFFANCAECHKARVAETQPVSLALTPPIVSDTPRNLLNVVHLGISPPYGAAQRKMPTRRLSVGEMEALAAFVRWRFSDLPPWDGVAEIAEEVTTTSH